MNGERWESEEEASREQWWAWQQEQVFWQKPTAYKKKNTEVCWLAEEGKVFDRIRSADNWPKCQ